ncbi:hypothetical protein RJ641_034936 [Dillenia turbinata]|uniref:Uncharacterized protein n=1 Tax=Dillenia turbinata TaxID=194707 RepID=A0AAN8VS33_9MAGN
MFVHADLRSQSPLPSYFVTVSSFANPMQKMTEELVFVLLLTIATVCMFFAGKVEETPCPLKDVILVSYEIIHKKDPSAVQRIKQKVISTIMYISQFANTFFHSYSLLTSFSN